MIDDDSSLSTSSYTKKSHLRYNDLSKSLQEEDQSIQAMRWFILIALIIGFFGSIAASIIIKSPLPLSIGLLLRPIITHFFPKDPKPK